MKKDALIIVRGGGDLATGTIHRLWSAGLRVLVLETTQPAAIRRQVALCEAVYEGEAIVEGLRAVRIEALEQAQSVWAQGAVPVLVDPEGACIARAKPAGPNHPGGERYPQYRHPRRHRRVRCRAGDPCTGCRRLYKCA